MSAINFSANPLSSEQYTSKSFKKSKLHLFTLDFLLNLVTFGQVLGSIFSASLIIFTISFKSLTETFLGIPLILLNKSILLGLNRDIFTKVSSLINLFLGMFLSLHLFSRHFAKILSIFNVSDLEYFILILFQASSGFTLYKSFL